MKKIVRPLLAGAGLTGALAATNRALENAPLPTNALGGTRLPWTWRGYEIFATEAGSGPPVILVHSVAVGASSYEFRKLFALLARRHRVIALDLLGCGLSQKPRLPYTGELFVDQIADALRFTDEPTTVLASGAGAAFAVRAATRKGARIERLVLICPTELGDPSAFRARGAAVTALFRTPVLGEAAYNALASRASLRWHLERQVYGSPSHCTPEIVDHYYAVAHQRGARYVPAALIGGALDCAIARDLPFLGVPVDVLWGEKAPGVNPSSRAHEFTQLAHHARLTTFGDSGLLPHEEEPDAVDVALATPAAARPLR